MAGGWNETDREVNHAYEKYLDPNGVSDRQCIGKILIFLSIRDQNASISKPPHLLPKIRLCITLLHGVRTVTLPRLAIGTSWTRHHDHVMVVRIHGISNECEDVSAALWFWKMFTRRSTIALLQTKIVVSSSTS